MCAARLRSAAVGHNRMRVEKDLERIQMVVLGGTPKELKGGLVEWEEGSARLRVKNTSKRKIEKIYAYPARCLHGR